MTVKQLLSNLDSRELSEWIALNKMELDEKRQAELAAKAKAKETELRNKPGANGRLTHRRNRS